MMLYSGWTPLQDACFWRRSLYERVGGLNPATRYAADFELFLKFALSGTCAYVPVAFSAFRKHAGQVSISKHAITRTKARHSRSNASSTERLNSGHGAANGLLHLAARTGADLSTLLEFTHLPRQTGFRTLRGMPRFAMSKPTSYPLLRGCVRQVCKIWDGHGWNPWPTCAVYCSSRSWRLFREFTADPDLGTIHEVDKASL